MNLEKGSITIGRNMFLAGLAETAVYTFFRGETAMTRPRPLPDALQSLNPAMAYISGALLLLGIAVFLWMKKDNLRANGLFLIVGCVLLLVTSRHILNLWRDHINAFKSLWFISGSLLIVTTLDGYGQWKSKVFWLNLIVIALFFIDCGIAHFQFAGFVQELIPTFIPFRLFFTYFCGVCLILGGVGLFIPQVRNLAALLSAVQITGWFILLHVPRAFMMGGDEWIGVGESLAIAGICLMIYGIGKSNTNQT